MFLSNPRKIVDKLFKKSTRISKIVRVFYCVKHCVYRQSQNKIKIILIKYTK